MGYAALSVGAIGAAGMFSPESDWGEVQSGRIS
jgi:hypothetical protein